MSQLFLKNILSIVRALSIPLYFIMVTRGPRFMQEKVTALLNIIEEELPDRTKNWERVTDAHCMLLPDLKQPKSLKFKF